MFLFTATLFALSLTLGNNPALNEVEQVTKYSSRPDSAKIESTLSFISNNLTKGRLTGTSGNLIVSSFLRDKIASMGMIPFYSTTFSQSFKVPGDSVIGRNIIGVLPSLYYTDKYIIVSAHYDHLGMLGGKIYNGADDNASGVTALLTIAQWFSQMRYNREGPRVNIIFALFDAKESSLAGSEYFANNLKIPVSNIKYNINLDQIGCTFAPPGDKENYLLYVADSRIKRQIRSKLELLNKFHNLEMDIDHSFYGSPAFYEVFFKTGDHYNLSKAGIPSILFTSGVHMHTYKPTDEYYFINYPVLINRIRLIYLLTHELTTM